MHASVHLTSALVALIGICQGISSGALQAAEPEPVGTFTAVQGQVQMTRPGGAVPVSVKLSDAVAYKAIIETQDASRAKALFLDDSMLAVAENTKIQINEQIYDPKHGKRNMVFNLLEGKVRALVTKVFQGSGSRFEIRTPSAMAAARGTYFVVWIEKGASESGMPSGVSSHVAISPAPAEANPALLPSQEFTGIANIGDSGSVDFTSNGQTVTVKPGHFAIALPGQPPAPPVPLAKNIPPQVSQAIRATSVVNAPKAETPIEMFRATAGVVPQLPQFNSGPAAVPLMNASMKPGSQPGMSPTPAGMLSPATIVVVTPPAAFSGAVDNIDAPGKIPAFINPPTPGFIKP